MGGSCRVFFTRQPGSIRSAGGTRAGAGAKGRLRGGSCGGRSHQSAPGARPRSPDAHRRATERGLKHTLKNPEKNRGVTFSKISISLSKERGRVIFWLEVHAISYRRQADKNLGGGSRWEGEPEGAGRRGAPAGERNRQRPQRRRTEQRTCGGRSGARHLSRPSSPRGGGLGGTGAGPPRGRTNAKRAGTGKGERKRWSPPGGKGRKEKKSNGSAVMLMRSR